MQIETTPKVKPLVPPYLSYKTFRAFIDSLRQGMPNRIDRSLMGTMSGAVQGGLTAALRYLYLIGDQGAPTEHLIQLVNSEGADHQRVLREILIAGYAFLFADGFDLTNATSLAFEERFREVASGDTVRKCEAFFLAAAQDADIPISRHILARGARGRPNTRQKLRRGPIGSGLKVLHAITDIGHEERSNSPAPPISVEQMLLAKFPSFDPAWSEEVQAKWFDAFNRIMQAMQTNAAADDGGDD